MKVALDSNRYTDLCRGVAQVVEVIEDAAEIYVPLIVVAEQRAGFAHGASREKNERILTRFLNEPGVSVLTPDEQTTYFYADAYAYLRKKGKPIPTNDLWIAALVLQHQLVLFDRDSDFDHLPQLARLRLAP
ncbi:MAG TPA: type II toxin-antitoxin system VapC family toxin [Labilithrix sp.]|jgi:predicted nucleic acid-binding protein|nr:type II toxin-antitoxin system VapC family toxin [Labilithrix sp.]